ncbi:VOC family protein [Salinirarus marinus]|uniref:VOC family protein n=1 Tax=Salinirarus marinus TaxID=3068310 RepID=UPI003C6BEA52
MLTGLDSLALEVADLDRARAFYVGRLGLSPVRESDAELAFRVGETDLILRRPTTVPRGGLHTHYAFTTPVDEFDDWLDRLSDLDPAVYDFGAYRSLYVDDPDGHCVEIGSDGAPDAGGEGDDAADGGLTGIFELVLEVADLERAETAYRGLGFEVVDRGEERRRVRLRGPIDLELWEPQLGIADARGGVHVDVGFRTDDPEAAAEAFAEWTIESERAAGGRRVRDRDGHVVTFS